MTDQSYRHITTNLHEATLVVSIQEPKLRNAETCYALRDEMIAAIDAAGAENVLLDLSSVDFVGSVGFLAFLAVRRRVGNGKVILCGMSDHVRGLCRACSLSSADPTKSAPFGESASVESALASL